MNVTDFTYLLQKPETITPEQTRELSTFIEEYPYFQSARILQLKGLHNQNSFHFNKKLKVAAAYTTDRNIVFEFITARNFAQHTVSKQITGNQSRLKNIPVIAEEVRAISNIFKSADYREAEIILTPEIFTPKQTEPSEETIKPTETNNKPKPITYTENTPVRVLNEKHSFMEWLQLSKVHVIKREESDETSETITNTEITNHEQKSKFDLIDKFLKVSPKIAPVKEAIDNRNLAKEASAESPQLMTETLAKIYMGQKKYKKAIKAYEILILKYPEKSSFFADQIEEIKKLKNIN